MTRPPLLRSRRLRIATALILAVGLSAAFAIYLAASAPVDDPLGDPNDSKQYLRQMQVYGGTANLLASQLREWFASLWHGTRLAGTIACLTILLAAAVWCFGAKVPEAPSQELEVP